MPFGIATVVTNLGKRTAADRLQTTPTRNAFKFSAIGTGATAGTRTAAVTDTVLSAESGSRVSGAESTVTITNTGDTYQVVAAHSIGGTVAVDEAALFDASSVGNMGVSATFAILNLVNGDTLTLTWKTQAT